MELQKLEVELKSVRLRRTLANICATDHQDQRSSFLMANPS